MRLRGDAAQLLGRMPPPMRILSSVLLVQIILTLHALGGIAPSLSEKPVSDVMYGPAPGYQDNPGIASDGENFLVAWYDERAWPPVMYAARVNRDGELLDPTDIRIPVFAYPSTVVFAGDAYLVLWSVGHNLYMARVSREGNVIDTQRLLAENVPRGQFTASSNGSRIVIAWRDRFSVFSAQGELLQRDVRLPVAETPDFASRIVTNGSGFLLAWWNSYGMPALQTWLLDPRGQPIGSMNTVSTNSGSDISAASDGRDYILLYSNLNTRSVESRRISGDGMQIGPAFAVPALHLGAANVPIAWNGTHYLAFLHAAVSAQSSWPQAVRRMQIDSEGKPVDAGMQLVAGAFAINNLPVVASNGREVVVAWRGRRLFEDFDDIYAVRGSGTTDPTTTGTLVSRSAIPQAEPSIAFSGRNYLVVRQERSGVYLNRVLPNGEHLDGTGTFIDSMSLSRNAAPRVIFDGENYVIAWIAEGAINGVSPVLRLARVQPDSGTVLDVLGVVLDQAAGVGSFDIAGNGETTAVVWSDGQWWTSGQIHAARFNRNLQLLDVRGGLSPKEMDARNPAVAWNGSEWLIAFDEDFWCPICLGPVPILIHANLRAVRLSPLFTLLDPQPITVAADDPEWNLGARIASDGDEFAIVWTDTYVQSHVRARHMKSGAFLDGPALLANGRASSVVWDGSRYAAAYDSKRQDGNFDALLTHIGRAGEPLPSDQLIISATADDETLPRLVAATGGTVTAAYIRVATEPLYGGVARVFLRQPAAVRTRPVRSR